MTSLSDIIRALIVQNGPMNLAEFMALALGHPVHGYYMKKDPFGAGGDFTTAPETSQMFGELIGLWIAHEWINLGQPGSCVLAEAGPGRGTLMADALRATRGIPGFHEAISVHLLETSPVLRAKQAQALSGFDAHWHEEADIFFMAGAGPFFLIANEFLDALPARQVQRQDGQWRERAVGLDKDGAFRVGLSVYPLSMDSLDGPGCTAEEGAILEWSDAAQSFAQQLGKAIASRGGAGLLIDYGYAEPAFGDSLQAVKNHRYVSILDEPGDVDLTVHVNFKSIADAILTSGCSVFGPVDQGQFLLKLGIRERMKALNRNAGTEQAEAVHQAFLRLTDADAMGHLFKAMAILPKGGRVPAGFGEIDADG
jgi:NADH dehydrogenase [ubiquinone] 1 alpha subcomplex assembly factor 7